jgi:predicted PurR-regulated permease PerM
MSDRSAPVAWIWRQDRPPRWLPRAALAVAVVFLAVGLVWGVIAQLKDLFVIVLCALFIAFAIEPGVNWLAKRGWPRSLSTLTIYVLGILAFASLAYALGGLIADQVAALAKSLPSIVNSLSDFLHQHFNINLSQQLQKLQDHLGTIGTTVASNALGIGATILGSIFDLLTVALFAFYFAADGPQFRRGVCSVLPPARQIMVLQVWELAISKTAGFLYSRVLLAAVSAVCHAVFFAIIGLPYSITLGLFVGVVGQFIPTVGTYIGAALPALVALSVSPSKAVLVIIFAIIYAAAPRRGLWCRHRRRDLDRAGRGTARAARDGDGAGLRQQLRPAARAGRVRAARRPDVQAPGRESRSRSRGRGVRNRRAGLGWPVGRVRPSR